MDCEEVRDRLADHLTAPSGEPSDAIKQHLARCRGCREEAEAIEATWTALGAVPVPAPNSSAMRDRFDAMLDAYTERHPQTDLLPARRPQRRWLGRPAAWRPIQRLAGIAALLAIGMGAGWWLRATPPNPSAEIQSLRRELRDTQQLVMLSLMQQTSASERLRGVGWSREIEEPGPEVVSALLDTLEHDPNINVRLGCVDALMRFSGKPTVRQAVVRALDESRSPMIQIALIDFVVDTGATESLGTLQRLSKDGSANETVRQRAALGLKQLM